MIEQIPPHDIAAEQAVLGAMLLSEAAVGDVVEVIKNPGDYYRPAHETIHRAIIDLYAKGEPADPITVTAELTKRGELGAVGGPGYIHGLVGPTAVAVNADYYADIVHTLAIRRHLAEASDRIGSMARSGEGDTVELLDRANAELQAITAAEDSQDGAFIADAMERYMDRLEHLQENGRDKGIKTGFFDLDSLTGGLHPGQVIVIAARPAVGKSTLAVDIAREASIRGGHTVAFFSLEMSHDELMERILSAEARVGLHHLRNKGGMTDDDWTRIARRMPDVTAAPLHIDTTPGQTVTQIKARCRRVQQRHGLGLVIIDYLQLIEAASSRKTDNRQVEVSAMSRGLKLMAKELGVPVVVVAQLNRGPEQRSDKKPMMSDLRESGAVEQDADMVILIHREDAYDKESPRAGETDLIVAKHRNGPTATITVASQLHYSRFVDMAQT